MVNLSQQLSGIGFSDYEAKVYLPLVSNDMISAGDLYKITETPQGKIYSILAKLEEYSYSYIVSVALNNKKMKSINYE